MYVVVDIETTGLNPSWEKITEISLISFDGNGITEEFTSLINPERLIPPHITQLTGITTSMVENAPRFYEIAKKIVEMTEGKILVGHNVRFDYNFIRAEFQHLGYEFTRKTLCTVKLSQKLIPGLESYGLGNLSRYFHINNSSRHRAYGDAYATYEIFKQLLLIEGKNGSSFSDVSAIPFKDLHPKLNRSSIDKLPDSCGIYYLYNENNELIYIGKSLNIRKRVIEHLSKSPVIRMNEMRQEITDVDYELTGSELIALLMESAEIKKHQPVFNRMQKRKLMNTALFYNEDEKGYICFYIGKNNGNSSSCAVFPSKIAAKVFLENLQKKFNLCQKLCELYPSSEACFEFTINKCKGACIGLEPADQYNLRVKKAIEFIEGKRENLFIIDKGRKARERSVVALVNGKYIGFGYIDLDIFAGSLEELHECICYQEDNRDVQLIIRQYLQKNKAEKVIKY